MRKKRRWLPEPLPAGCWFACDPPKCQAQALGGWHEFLTAPNGTIDAQHSWMRLPSEGVKEARESVRCSLIWTVNKKPGTFSISDVA